MTDMKRGLCRGGVWRCLHPRPVRGGAAGPAGRRRPLCHQIAASVTLAVVRTVVPGALGLPLLSGNLGIVCELPVFLPANSFLKHTRVEGFVCIWLGPGCRMRAVSLFLAPSIERWVPRLQGDRGTAETVNMA